MVVVLRLGLFDLRTKNTTHKERFKTTIKSERFYLQLNASRFNWRHCWIQTAAHLDNLTDVQPNMIWNVNTLKTF